MGRGSRDMEVRIRPTGRRYPAAINAAASSAVASTRVHSSCGPVGTTLLVKDDLTLRVPSSSQYAGPPRADGI